jgi:hypothetical protein
MRSKKLPKTRRRYRSKRRTRPIRVKKYSWDDVKFEFSDDEGETWVNISD